MPGPKMRRSLLRGEPSPRPEWRRSGDCRSRRALAPRRAQPTDGRRPAGGVLPQAEQDVLASWLLAEIGEEDEFDRAIAASSGKLAGLAQEALAEHRAGLSEELDSERL